jgi:hypothetical protein
MQLTENLAKVYEVEKDWNDALDAQLSRQNPTNQDLQVKFEELLETQ